MSSFPYDEREWLAEQLIITSALYDSEYNAKRRTQKALRENCARLVEIREAAEREGHMHLADLAANLLSETEDEILRLRGEL